MKSRIVFGVMAGLLMVSGCDVTTPSRVNVTRVQVQEVYKTETFRLAKIDQERMGDMIRFYKSEGAGPVRILATYMDGSSKAGAAALNDGRKIQKVFAGYGVDNVQVDTVAVDDAEHSGQAVISFRTLKATPPAGCGKITGSDGGETQAEDENYMLGCESQTAFSQMVANPEDILGREGTGKGDSRRQGNVTEPYKAGTANELFYSPASASEIGAQ